VKQFEKKLYSLLQKLKENKVSIQEVMEKLAFLPYEELGFAKIDTHREIRRGFPEAIFCEGKTPTQLKEIVKKMYKYGEVVLGLRANRKQYIAVKKEIKEKVKYYEISKTIIIGKIPPPSSHGKILVITAGTGDIPVAEEAYITAKVMGNKVEKLYDVGVAGIHRLVENKEKILEAKVIIVVAGMEGALPSVVAGMVKVPVIGVPTSVGYGVNLQGIAPLFTMLNSCAPGVVVVNIDNGFGAGRVAGLINQLAK